MAVDQAPPAPRYRTENWRANARALGKQDHPKGSSNYTMLQGFEWYTPGGGVYYEWLESKAKELGDMGITAIWCPPPTKCDTADSVGYSPYDLWDLGEFDQKGGKATKWGTKEQLVKCIKALKDNGIAVYIGASVSWSFRRGPSSPDPEQRLSRRRPQPQDGRRPCRAVPRHRGRRERPQQGDL